MRGTHAQKEIVAGRMNVWPNGADVIINAGTRYAMAAWEMFELQPKG
jgi:hypothetical protein